MEIKKHDVFANDPVTDKPFVVTICNDCGGQAERWLNNDYYCDGCNNPHRKRCNAVRFADAGWIRIAL